jgi:hypothetical protein
MDVLVLAIAITLFATTTLYVRACDRLKGGRP